MRPHRDVVLPEPLAPAFARTLALFDRVLGANVARADAAAGLIEAGFGLVNSERIRASVEDAGNAHSRVRIEAIFPAGATAVARSRAVEALAEALIEAGGTPESA